MRLLSKKSLQWCFDEELVPRSGSRLQVMMSAHRRHVTTRHRLTTGRAPLCLLRLSDVARAQRNSGRSASRARKVRKSLVLRKVGHHTYRGPQHVWEALVHLPIRVCVRVTNRRALVLLVVYSLLHDGLQPCQPKMTSEFLFSSALLHGASPRALQV